MKLSVVLTVALIASLAFALFQRARRVTLVREHHIRSYVFPDGVFQDLQNTYAALPLKDLQLAARALRQFFIVHSRSGGRLIAMPSKITDDLWHAFILDTRSYKDFCQAAFGSYFHHVPESSMKSRNTDGNALWRTWRLACLEENINPVKATRLPLLFALDSKLAIPGAVSYDPASFKPPKNSGGCGGIGCGGGGDGCGDGAGCGGGCGGGGE